MANQTAGPGLRVLLVEDDGPLAGYLTVALRTGGELGDIRTAGDLAGALDGIRVAPPDAVLLDLNLPDSNGLGTLQAVLAAAPHLPVVVLTGVADAAIASRALQLGAQDWLVKGVLDPDVLQRAVRYAVERKRLTDRLVEAQKLEIAGRLANGVAHEFNNVLTAIAGSTQLLEEAEDPESRASALDLLRRSARQGIALSRQLLSLARNPPMNTAVVSTATLIDDGRLLIQAVLPSAIRLEIGPVADLPVRLDPGQFDQMLLNLVINARDAMPDGGALRISLTSEPAATAEVSSGEVRRAVLRVSDSGLGIDPAIRERLFEPFFSTKGTRGTGLGLAVVAEIVGRFGGAIDVESRLGGGTTIVVSLPTAPEETDDD